MLSKRSPNTTNSALTYLENFTHVELILSTCYDCLKKAAYEFAGENSDDMLVSGFVQNPDTFSYSRGWRGNERVAKRSATRWSTRSGGGIGPYHGDSSCTTRSEGFSRWRLPRGWKWGLKRFRWETQQGVNGSRHAGGAWNVSLEARRKRAGQRKGRGSRGEIPGAHVRAHTRVACCYAWTGTHVRARAHVPEVRRHTTVTPPPPLYHDDESARGLCSRKLGLPRSFGADPAMRRAVPSPFYFCNGAGSPLIFLVKIRERIDARSWKIDEREIVNSVSRKWLRCCGSGSSNFLTKIVMQMIHCRSR